MIRLRLTEEGGESFLSMEPALPELKNSVEDMLVIPVT